jgi:hypothetical protein
MSDKLQVRPPKEKTMADKKKDKKDKQDKKDKKEKKTKKEK